MASSSSTRGAGTLGPGRRTARAGDSLFSSYSTTKGVAAAALHILADRGLVDDAAPIARYWPAFGARPGRHHGRAGDEPSGRPSHDAGAGSALSRGSPAARARRFQGDAPEHQSRLQRPRHPSCLSAVGERALHGARARAARRRLCERRRDRRRPARVEGTHRGDAARAHGAAGSSAVRASDSQGDRILDGRAMVAGRASVLHGCAGARRSGTPGAAAPPPGRIRTSGSPSPLR